MPHALTDDGIRIAYRAFGPASGEPVLMIQGLGTDSKGWIAQRLAFGRKYRCLAPDNRGIGGSDRPAEPFDIERMADDMIAVLDDAGVDSAHVMGASLGGIVAQLVAVRYPERVRSLVLACTACHHTNWRRELLADWSELVRSQGMRTFAAQNLRWIVGPRSMRRFWPLMRVVGPVAMGCPPSSFVAQVDAILAADDSIRGELTALRVPTLVLVGSQDILTPLADSEELAERIPGASLAVVPGAAHGFMFENAATFNRVVTRFLDGVIADQAQQTSPAAAPVPLAGTA
ncbi:MAG: alpha/beta fold hydrolase [Acidimicrobiales bacterium]